MRVWMVAAEMVPFSKVGGLGDVLGALSGALAGLGCEVTVAIPFLGSMRSAGWEISTTGVEVEAHVDGVGRRADVLETRAPGGVRVLLIDYPPYFDREGLYGTPKGDHPDNAERFAFLSHTALAALSRLAPDPDVVHTHDWQTGLVPFLLRAPEHLGADPVLARAGSVHTIHNLAYQGLFPPDVLPRIGVAPNHFHPGALEFWGQVNFLKAGLVFADALTSVSPTYGREIQTPEQGWGLDGLLRERAGVLHGILNGIDTEVWDPSRDTDIAARFDANDLTPRSGDERDVRGEFGLPTDGRPLVGVVNRLVGQKGIDLILGLEDRIEALGLQWAVLGAGENRYEAAVQNLARRHPGTFAARVGFEESLARRIYAGSDFFCMPSLFEPCGLGQMIALRYGSLPVVRRTGGLADTVVDVSDPGGFGFVFDEPTPDALAGALRRASGFAAQPGRLLAARRRAMGCDVSWAGSARRYLELYREVRRAPRS